MLKVKSIVRINTQSIQKLNRAGITALKETADALLTEVTNEGVVPRDRGTLEDGFIDDTQAEQGKVSLVYSTPYARRLYYNPETVSVREYTIKKGKRAGQKVKSYTAHKMTFSQSAWTSEKRIKGKRGKWLKRKKKIKHDGNPNAKDHWLEDWQAGGKNADFVPNTFKKIYKRLIHT